MLADHVADPPLVAGVAERPEETDRDRVAPGVDKRADRLLGFHLVQRDDDFAEAVDALGHAADQALRHDRVRLLALGEMNDFGDVARGHAARATHDVDCVFVPLGRDQPDLRALPLDQRVGADGRAVGENRDALAERVERQVEALGCDPHRRKHPVGEVPRGRGGLGGGDVAGAVENDAVGEGAADVDTHEVRTHSFLLVSYRAPRTAPVGALPATPRPSPPNSGERETVTASAWRADHPDARGSCS